jgi:cytochrome b561
MNTSTASARYSRGAIAFHWIIAILILMNFAIAWRAEDLPKPEAMAVMGYHKAWGITILVLTLGRIAWRLGHKPPPLVETLKSWEAAVAKVTHFLFYALTLAVPLAGWGMHSAASGKPVSIFGLFSVPPLPVTNDRPTAGLFHDLHETFAAVMLLLAVLHILAALKHHFVDRDGTMRRIIPWMR